jgi:outer membrane biosynthesis protein TonB
MLTIIILAALSVIVGVWILNKNSKSTTTETKPEVPTVEEEPIGYESGSFASIATEEPTPVAVSPKPKKKTSKNTAKNESLAKMEAKPKAPKAPKAPKKAKNA